MEADFRESLAHILHKAQTVPVKGCCIEDWRATFYKTKIISLGVKNNIGGSVYTPPSYKFSESAEIYLVWDDGKCSRTKLQKPADGMPFDWDRELNFWRLAAFEDPYAKSIPHPLSLPETKIASEEIKAIIERDNHIIFDEQEKILGNKPEGAQLSASINALWGENSVCTSTGINVNYHESRYTVAWNFDSQISRGFAERRLIHEDEWQKRWDESVVRYHLIREKAEPVTNKTRVVFAPAIVEQMIEQYIFPNFNGENILEGQSKFSKEDFDHKIKIFHKGLSMEINPLRPYSTSSYILTSEGIPAICTSLIYEGELSSPYLNCKNALRWGTSTTGIPLGPSGILINHIHHQSWPEMLNSIDDGILILSVLGLHTQNPLTGSFSLSAPASLRISKGCLVGKADVRINGNYWEILKSSDLILGISELDNCPYLLTNCFCENI